MTTNYTLDLNAGLTQALADGTSTYLYGAGRIAQQSAAGKQYFLGDALGSVRQLADSDGAVSLARSYQPYGKLLASDGSSETSYGFTGEWTDTTGLVYLRARYYAPQSSRFITKDTWEGNNTSPLSLNRWSYAEGNPINFSDPSGRWCVAGFTFGPGRSCSSEEKERWARFYGAEATYYAQLHSDINRIKAYTSGFLHEYIDGVSIIGASSIAIEIAYQFLGCYAYRALDDPDVVMGRYAGRKFLAAQAGVELGIGIIEIGTGGAISGGSGGVFAIAGVPVSTMGLVLAGHGALVLAHEIIAEQIDPLPYIVFSQGGGGGNQKTPIYGSPQKGATPEHNAKVEEIAEELANRNEYEVIWIDKEIHLSTRGKVPAAGSPDILALDFTKKRAYMVEVPSPTQILKGGGYTVDFIAAIRRATDAFTSSGWTIIFDIIEP